MIKNINKYITLIFLVIIFLIGFYIRVEGVLTNSFAFTYDVGRDMLQVQQIVVAYKIPLIGQTTGLGGLFYGPWWYYLLTPAFIVSGGNPQGVAFFMVLIGMATIFIAYLYGKMVRNRRLGLILASLTAFSPVMVGYSNQIWNPNVAPLYVFIVLIALFKIQKNYKNLKWYLLLGFMLGLLLDTEIVFGGLFIISIIIMYVVFLRKRWLNRNIFFAVIGFFITLSPRILFEFRHGFIMTQTLLRPERGSEGVFSFPNFLIDIPARILTLFNNYRDTFSAENTALAFVTLAFTIATVVLRRKKLNQTDKNSLAGCGIVFLVFLIGTSFFARAIWGYYLVGLPVFYLLSLAIVIDELWGKFTSVGLLILFVVLWIMINPLRIFGGFGKPLWEGNAAVYRNQVAVIDYIYKQAKGRKFNEIVYTPSVYDYPYRYLFNWYGKNKYGYLPSSSKESLFYVTIEPDPGYEGRIVDWLKVREQDGKVIGEKVVKGGIRVQTRIH